MKKKKLKAKVETLEAANTELKEKIEASEKYIKLLEGHNAELTKEISIKDEKIDLYETRNNKNQKDLFGSAQKISDANRRINAYKVSKNRLLKEVESLQSELEVLENESNAKSKYIDVIDNLYSLESRKNPLPTTEEVIKEQKTHVTDSVSIYNYFFNGAKTPVESSIEFTKEFLERIEELNKESNA